MRVLFVCLGNICRSPLAEGILQHQLHEAGLPAEVDSCGTGGWHAGERADPRSRDVAKRHGIELTSRARQLQHDDFARFDLIVPMDAKNEQDLHKACPPEHRDKIRRLGTFDPQGDADVPDPYYGGPRGFDDVYEQLDRSCRQIVEQLRAS